MDGGASQTSLPEPRGVAAPEVTPEVGRLLSVLEGETSRRELQAALGLKDDDYFREAYLAPALARGLIEMTLPEKPRSRLQRYRLTELGRRALKAKTR